MLNHTWPDFPEALVWKDRGIEFNATLEYITYDRGSSSVTVVFQDVETRLSYFMFLSDFHLLLTTACLYKGLIHGRWGFIKRGDYYGIQLREELED